MSSGPAYAEWTKLDVYREGDEKSIQYHYADLDRIRRTEHLANMWTLYDLSTAGTFSGKPYFSIKQQIQYDCQQGLSQTVAIYAYSGKMGKGSIVELGTEPQKWQPVIPDSVGEEQWKVACGKK